MNSNETIPDTQSNLFGRIPEDNHLDASEQQNDDGLRRCVTFRLDDEVYGVDVMHVKEVLRYTEIAPVPGSPNYVLGIINLRGNVVTVIDTRTRFGLVAEDPDEMTRIVVMEANDQVIGFMVDSISEVRDIPISIIEGAPHLGNEETSAYIEGVASVNDELVILVDLTRILTETDLNEMAFSP
ncbi:MAG: chemotaxis protein CheW [Pseudomonadota bacterium]|nr:chemotaxis protein CheW [Pseudomonadota bacterium]